MTEAGAVVDVVAAMTGFARELRAVGVGVDSTRLATSLAALDAVDPADAGNVYWAARLTMCAEPDDLPVFDAVFDRWFRGVRTPLPAYGAPPPPAPTLRVLAADSSGDGGDAELDDDALRVAASTAETLRHRDIAGLTDAERAEVHRLIELLRPRVARRPSMRLRPARRGSLDIHATVRQMLRDGGEPGALRRRDRSDRPRRLVLLLDVSGSMSPYADVLLRFAHAAERVAPRSTEVFTMGTRLTRVSRQLRIRDPEQALRAAGTAIPDWSGGTRLGETLRAFLDLWGQRGLARSAVVVIASDGWERGEADLLGEQLARLARLSTKIVWVNPHKGKAGFAPVTAGMLAAMPHIDDLIAGHSFDALRAVAEVIAHA